LNASGPLDPHVAFFDALAEVWDTRDDPAEVRRRLDEGLAAFGVTPDERVLDVGCGTGNMTGALLRRLSPAGRIIAVDISPRMIEAAKRKNPDGRVEWRCVPLETLELEDGVMDRAVCLAVWPHFEDPAAAAQRLHRALGPGGMLHVWHTIPRGKVNAIHAASEAVRGHVLAPASQTAGVLTRCGFAVATCIDDEREYLVTARKAAPCTA
jgi:ubiquinone/menaquinone biosynthesis C-methylase UbiE